MHKYLHKLFGILLHWRFVSSPSFINVFIYSYHYGLLDVNFILWVIIQYYFILLLKLFQLWPFGALSVGSYKIISFYFHFIGEETKLQRI